MDIYRRVSVWCINNTRTQFWILCGLILTALIVRLKFFVGVGYNDDCAYLSLAHNVLTGINPLGYSWYSVRVGTYFPTALIWKVFGISEFTDSLYYLLCSVGGVYIIYLLGKTLFNRETGLIAATLLAFFPADVTYSTQIGPNIPLCVMFSLSLLLYIKAYKQENYKLYALLSGIFIGISYLCYEMLVLLLPVPILYSVLNSGKSLKKTLTILCLVIVGFLFIMSTRVIYFYSMTGKWFYGEKLIEETLKADKNINANFRMYPDALFNLNPNYDSWDAQHLFGISYYILILSLIYLIVSRSFNKDTLFLTAYLVGVFLIFQYLIYYAAVSMEHPFWNCKHTRYLLVLLLPTILLISQAVHRLRNRLVQAAVMLLFILSSLYYIDKDCTFLRRGMDYVRESAYLLQRMPPKKTYIPDGWTYDRFKAFSNFDKIFLGRTVVYQKSKLEDIKDGYVLTDVNPYNYVVWHDFPDFMRNPPSQWILLSTINIKNIGIFNKFKPKIFYAPRSTGLPPAK